MASGKGKAVGIRGKRGEKGKGLSVGAVISDAGSTVEYKTGSWRSFRPVVDRKKCTRCGLCFVHCPDGAVRKNKDGSFEIDLDYCKGCGICARECPLKCIAMVLEEK